MLKFSKFSALFLVFNLLASSIFMLSASASADDGWGLTSRVYRVSATRYSVQVKTPPSGGKDCGLVIRGVAFSPSEGKYVPQPGNLMYLACTGTTRVVYFDSSQGFKYFATFASSEPDIYIAPQIGPTQIVLVPGIVGPVTKTSPTTYSMMVTTPLDDPKECSKVTIRGYYLSSRGNWLNSASYADLACDGTTKRIQIESAASYFYWGMATISGPDGINNAIPIGPLQMVR